MKPSAPRYMTTEALAQRWGVSAGTLCNWRSRGTGPTYVKFGNSVRYSTTDIERFEAVGRCQVAA